MNALLEESSRLESNQLIRGLLMPWPGFTHAVPAAESGIGAGSDYWLRG